MQITRFLDVALASATKVKVLRRLVLDSKPKSGRALARDVEMSHAQVLHVLHELHSEGIVLLERIGRSYAYSLRRDALPVKDILIPLFQKERSLPADVAHRVAAAIETPTLSISIFGSVAKGADHAQSDLDMVFVVEGRPAQLSLEEEIAGAVSDTATSLGVTLGPYVITRVDLQRKYRANDPFIRELASTCRQVSGSLLMEVISGGSSRLKDAESRS